MRVVAILLALFVAFSPWNAASASSAKPLPVDQAFAMSLASGPDASILLRWSIADGYYLYRDSLTAQGPDKSALPLETSSGTLKDDPNFGMTEIYYGQAEAKLGHAGSEEVEISFQGCQEDGICYAPETRLINPTTLEIKPGPSAFPWKVEVTKEVAQAPSSPSFELATDEGLVASLHQKGGTLLVLLMFGLFGLLLAFTPCVFPIYPILASALKREETELTRSRSLALSLSYVLGLASAFALLGALAGWSGQNFQLLLQSPFTVGAVAAVFVLLALSMFGLFELRLPQSLSGWIANRTRKIGGSTSSTALLGFSSVLIIGPCVTAPLAGALLYISSTGNVALGAAALFALGVGKGIPLIILGTFGGHILPRAGKWLESTNRIFGFGLLAMAIWIATPLLPNGLDLLLWALLLIGFAVLTLPAPLPLARVAGLIALVQGVLLLIGAAAGSNDPLRPLMIFTEGTTRQSSELAFAKVQSASDLLTKLLNEKNAPTMLYFTADWCVTCRGIERSVLPDKKVQNALQVLQLLKADLSTLDTDKLELMKQLQVVGPPTMIFLDQHKREIAGTRLIGSVTVNGLVEAVAKAGL